MLGRRRGRCGLRLASRSRRLQGEAGRDGHHLLLASAKRCSEHPELVQKYMGSVVPYSDNYFATLNSAVFTDG